MIFELDNPTVVSCIKNGGCGIMPTDTVFGIVAGAFSKDGVEKIFKLKKRDSAKPPVILVSTIADLKNFKVDVDKGTNDFLKKNWPGEISVIMPCVNKEFYYLHRGKNSLAFRMPDNKGIISFLKKTGPIATSSANLQGKSTVTTITQAQKIFKDKVDFYVNGKTAKTTASTIVKIQGGKVEIVRKGSGKIYPVK